MALDARARVEECGERARTGAAIGSRITSSLTITDIGIGSALLRSSG
jgi:hypothetical protein